MSLGTLHDVTHSLEPSIASSAAVIVPNMQPSAIPQSLTYAQLSAAVTRVSEFLASAGVRRGDFVCLIMDNSIEFVVSFLAITCTSLVERSSLEREKERERILGILFLNQMMRRYSCHRRTSRSQSESVPI
jgi:non-ribosomal peptide synthetase component F